MSRALDKGVKEALKHGDHGVIYKQISGVLAQRLDQLLEIELLGSSHPLEPGTSFMQDDNAIGIPKLRLIQAFIVARQKLQDGDTVLTEEILDATGVVLLMDAEHLTAANSRKRALQSETLKHQDSAHDLLLQEKYFIDSLLTGRLHRHTKSPILWSHRRWLLDRFRTSQFTVDIAEDLRKVVFVSGERHPRNYYAWCHARYLVETFDVDSQLLFTILEHTKKWCFSHHNDVSGWAFLLFLLDRCREESRKIFTETTGLTESFRWRNESVWYFLRTLALSEPSLLEDFHGVLAKLRQGTNETDKATLDKTATWIEMYAAE